MEKYYYIIFYKNLEIDHPEYATCYSSEISGTPFQALAEFMNHADDRDINAYEIKIYTSRKACKDEFSFWESVRDYTKYGYPNF